MGLYVEMMCDKRIMGCDPDDILRPLCWSDGNDNPQGVSAADARREARRQGWKVGPGNAAVCPGCLRASAKDGTSGANDPLREASNPPDSTEGEG